MTECTNETMRDLLPALLRGELTGATRAAVEAHRAACAACADEAALLERAGRLFAAATPSMDVAAILRALPAPTPGTATRPALQVVRGGGARMRIPRSVLAAAASLLLVVALSLATLRNEYFGGGTAVADVGPDSAIPVTPAPAGTAAAAAGVTLVGAGELADLGREELETLLAELEAIEATVAADPVSLQSPVVQTPGGL